MAAPVIPCSSGRLAFRAYQKCFYASVRGMLTFSRGSKHRGALCACFPSGTTCAKSIMMISNGIISGALALVAGSNER